jgi:Putative beta barrel porin-7 (BBP7)
MKKVIMCSLASVLIWAGVSLAQTVDALSTAPTTPFTEKPFYISAEALLWWMKDSPAPPPLVSTGILGQPGTRVVLGGEDLNTDMHPGLRVTAGYWEKERWGLEANFFYLSSQATSQSVSSSGQTGSQDLSIPFFDVTLPGESSTHLSLAGVFSGQAQEELSARMLGAELMGAAHVLSTGPWTVDFLGGFRYLNLREKFSFTTNSPSIVPSFDIFQTIDQFDTTNHFYGAQAGLRACSGWGPLTFRGTFKFALGAMVQSVDVDGFLLTNDFNGFGSPQRFPGGYFAQPTNMGNHTRTAFAVVPEIGLNVGYQITRRMNIFFGYTFLYTNNVVRPGDQIERSINPTQNASFTGVVPSQLSGPARPAFSFQESSFWAQGLNMGVVFHF